jgi:hypothetical protein
LPSLLTSIAWSRRVEHSFGLRSHPRARRQGPDAARVRLPPLAIIATTCMLLMGALELSLLQKEGI